MPMINLTRNLPYFAAMISLLLLLAGCGSDDSAEPETLHQAPENIVTITGCPDCHQLSLDNNHNFACTDCHSGNQNGADRQTGHKGLVAAPAHPGQMAAKCGSCHSELVNRIVDTSHYTLANKVNLVRKAFGAEEPLASLIDIPTSAEPLTPLALADDLLRRRCLRCHLFHPGDSYPATSHGTGCAACHLRYENGELASHNFISLPDDTLCLSCHYGNFVGADFYGRFEHDFNWEYWTPFSVNPENNYPAYGVNYHKLRPDVHQQSGMACIDCHSGQRLMTGSGAKITCKTCHLRKPADHDLPQNLSVIDNDLYLTTRLSSAKLLVPQAAHPAHRQYEQAAACTVCHAGWAFNDQGTHLLRLDYPEYDSWIGLTRQGSSEVEALLVADLFDDDGESLAIMEDKLSGEIKTGLWLKSYELRRWEINICKDDNGILQVCRPILDLHLSYTNEEQEVIFDAVTITKNSKKLRPYTPHTIGRAGAFFKDRLMLLESE